MRIMITNDDGIHAPGLAVAERIAAQVSDDVWIAAPMAEMSGVGHCISYTKPVRYEQHGAKRFAIDGTPADCVLVGRGPAQAALVGEFLKSAIPAAVTLLA